jgi:hypothetical protein
MMSFLEKKNWGMNKIPYERTIYLSQVKVVERPLFCYGNVFDFLHQLKKRPYLETPDWSLYSNNQIRETDLVLLCVTKR